jgi:hypothetical protein
MATWHYCVTIVAAAWKRGTMTHGSKWPTLGLALAVTACAAPSGGPPAGRAFDGTYVGQDTLLTGAPFLCGAAVIPLRIEVRGGTFAYLFQVNPPRTAPLAVRLAADGAAYGTMQYGTADDDLPFQARYRTDWVTLEGRISGEVLTASVHTVRCARQVVAQRALPG